MMNQYDEKGKLFTQVISKQPVRVVIQTEQTSIRGSIHVRPDSRIKDEVSGTEKFLAVTNAVVCALQGEKLYETRFLLVNMDHIVWIIPEEDIL